MTVRIGTSGWVYEHWRGVFYPEGLPQSGWFGHYARHFDTVEINYTFYRLPEEEDFDNWRAQAPAGFIYAVKASRYLTHMKKLKDPEEPLHNFFERAGRLREKLGPVLYQLPPNWRANLSRLEHFLSVLPDGPAHVIEFRDQSWLTEDVFRLLERHGVSHCIHDMRPPAAPRRVTAPPVYERLHGDADHAGGYSRDALEDWARYIEGWRNEGLDVFVYFNNDAGGHAVRDAGALKELVGDVGRPGN